MSKYQTINSSAELNYPKVLPTLDLNFAQEKALDPRITFSRSSGGTYVGPDGLIKIAGVNQPRFDHDPLTGECRGLLMEESRTNLLTYSQDYSNPVWNVPATAVSTVISNITTSPDGSQTADLITATQLTSDGSLEAGYRQNYTFTAGTSYTISGFVKANTGSIVRIGAFDGTAFITRDYNLTTDLFTNARGTLSLLGTSSTKFSDNWVRISLSFVAGNSGSGNASASLLISLSSIFVWGAQLEVGPSPSSYISTTTTTLTRSSDICTLPHSSYTYNPLNTTWVTQFFIPNGTYLNNDRLNYKPILCLDDNTANNSLELGVEGANPSVISYTSGLMNDAIVPKQNLIGNSTVSSSFTTTGGSIIQSSLPSPVGTNDAFLFVDNATDASYHLAITNISSPGFSTNFVHVVSVYAKRYNTDFVFLQASDVGNRSANAVFSFANPGAATQTVPGVFGTIYSTGMIDCGGGWYRLYIVFIVGSTAPVGRVAFGPAPAATGNTIWGPGLTYTSSGLGVFFSNPQIERSTVIGKYISTDSTSINSSYYNSITANQTHNYIYSYSNTNNSGFISNNQNITTITQKNSLTYQTLRVGCDRLGNTSNCCVRKITYYPTVFSEKQLPNLNY